METSESAVWSQDPSNMREWAKLPVVWKCRRLIVTYRDHLLVLMAAKGVATKYYIKATTLFFVLPFSFC